VMFSSLSCTINLAKCIACWSNSLFGTCARLMLSSCIKKQDLMSQKFDFFS
jgi:hypothetical protein